MNAAAIWILAERPSGEHLAQLDSHETVLIESLRMFTTRGVSRGEAVLLVLTPSHRWLFLQHLKAEGVDVDGLRRTGQLLLLDAVELLASFTLDGMPDATLFRMRLGDIVASMRPSGSTRKVRVFGEMVDLLWNSNQPAAISLEQLWNDLIEGSGLSLFCAYSTSHVHNNFPEVTCRVSSDQLLLENGADRTWLVVPSFFLMSARAGIAGERPPSTEPARCFALNSAGVKYPRLECGRTSL